MNGPQLPGFLRAVAGSRRSIRSRSAKVDRRIPDSICDLYAEWDDNWDIPGWIASPRGRWVDYQIDWYEQRRELLE